MRVFSKCIFDEIVSGTTAVVSLPEHDAMLASVERLSLHAVAQTIATGATPQLTVRLQHSGDGLTYASVSSGSPEIDRATLAGSGRTDAMGAMSTSAVALGRVRLSVSLNAGDVARVKVFVTGRINSRHFRAPAASLLARMRQDQDAKAGCGCAGGDAGDYRTYRTQTETSSAARGTGAPGARLPGTTVRARTPPWAAARDARAAVLPAVEAAERGQRGHGPAGQSSSRIDIDPPIVWRVPPPVYYTLDQDLHDFLTNHPCFQWVILAGSDPELVAAAWTLYDECRCIHCKGPHDNLLGMKIGWCYTPWKNAHCDDPKLAQANCPELTWQRNVCLTEAYQSWADSCMNCESQWGGCGGCFYFTPEAYGEILQVFSFP